MNCEGDEGPAVSMSGGIPAFGGHSLGGSIEKSATLTAKDSRLDIESETFFFAPILAGGGRKSGGYSLDDIPITAPALRAQAQSSHRADSEAFIVAGTLQANGKAAGSATQQDAESGLLVVHGTQDPGVSNRLAFALGRNNGAENAVLAFSCKDHGADAGSLAPTLRAMNHSGSHANAGGQVAVCITGDITHTLKAEGFDGSEGGTGSGQPIVAFTQNSRSEVRHLGGDGQIAGELAAETGAHQQNYLAYSTKLHHTSACGAGSFTRNTPPHSIRVVHRLSYSSHPKYGGLSPASASAFRACPTTTH